MPIILPTDKHYSAAKIVRLSRLLHRGMSLVAALAQVKAEDRIQRRMEMRDSL